MCGEVELLVFQRFRCFPTLVFAGNWGYSIPLVNWQEVDIA